MRWHNTPLAPGTTKWSAGEGQGVRELDAQFGLQRWLAVAILAAFVVGCSAPNLPDPAIAQKKAHQEKSRKAKLRYAAFLDEAAKAADLLASQPDASHLEAEINKLNKLLGEATDVYPEDETLDQVGKRCKGLIRFFTTSLTMIKRHFKGQGEVSEKTKIGVYRACVSNEKAARQTIGEVRNQLGLAPQGDDEK